MQVISRIVVAVALILPAAAVGASTTDLKDSDRARLAGCWKARDRDHETWTFRNRGDHGLEVLRHSVDTRHEMWSSVMYEPSKQHFAFLTRGRIHGLMIIFSIEHGRLEGSFFSNHDDGDGWVFTGTNITLDRC